MAWSPYRTIGLVLCCGHALYFMVTSKGDGYLGRGSVSRVAGLDSDKRGAVLHREVQRAAVAALARLYDETSSPFETSFSTIASVKDKGFPLAWQACTLRPLLSSALTTPHPNASDDTGAGPEPLHMVVLGGSSSAHAAKQCSFDTHRNTKSNANNVNATNSTNTSHTVGVGDPFAGRYSNILMEELFHDFFWTEDQDSSLEFDVINMAQGATDSVWNALMLDELVDAKLLHGADVILVEYGINDALGGTTKRPLRTNAHLAQMMNLWLWRVWSLFHNVGRSPPPVLFVYLWDANFYRPTDNTDGNNSNSSKPTFEINKDHLLQHGVGQTSWKAQHDVLEHYRNGGWSIGAVNVGAVVDKRAVANNPGVLLDDKHHPNCVGVHAITAMIRHVIYSDLVHCNLATTTAQQNHHQQQQPMVILSDGNNNSSAASELSQLLLDPNFKVGSIMEWEPNVGSSSLTLGKDSDYFNVSHVEADFGTKSYPWRADRKQSFTLTPCADTSTWEQQQAVHFTLLEPDLKWLGIGYHILPQAGDVDDVIAIEMTINTEAILLTDDRRHHNRTILEFDEVEIVKEWIRLDDYIQQPPSPQYTLSFCYKTVNNPDLLGMESEVARLNACPYVNSTTIQQICNIWDEASFELMDSCPYSKLRTVSEACFQWVDMELDRIKGERTGHGDPKEQITHPPQLNWIVGVIGT